MTFTDEQKARARAWDAGPFHSYESDRWWFPVDAWAWNLAQAEAKDLADESDCKAVYHGVETVTLHSHEDWEEGDEFCPPGGCSQRRAYAFEWVAR